MPGPWAWITWTGFLVRFDAWALGLDQFAGPLGGLLAVGLGWAWAGLAGLGPSALSGAHRGPPSAQRAFFIRSGKPFLTRI